MTYKNFKLDVDADGIALVTWNMPGRSMNVFTVEVMDELGQIVEKVATDAAIKGAVVTSGKEAFSGGADLTMLESLANVIKEIDKAKAKKLAMQEFFDAVAQDVADLSAARDQRQAVGRGDQRHRAWAARSNWRSRAITGWRRENEKTRARLSRSQSRSVPRRRRHAARAADDSSRRCAADLFRGELIRLDRGKAMKLVDEVVPQDKLVETAKAWIKSGGKGVQPWDEEGFKLPGGQVYSKAGMMTWPPANAIYRRETYDNYPGGQGDPAVRLSRALQLPMDQALTRRVALFREHAALARKRRR